MMIPATVVVRLSVHFAARRVESRHNSLYNSSLKQGVSGKIMVAGCEFMRPSEIEDLIKAGLSGCEAQVSSDDDTHFEAVVVCAAFAGKRPLARHQMVYKTLGDLMGGEIHALSIQALTPEEHSGALRR